LGLRLPFGKPFSRPKTDRPYPKMAECVDGRIENHFRRVPTAESDYSSDGVCSAVGCKAKAEWSDDRESRLPLGCELLLTTVNDHECE